jgi:hypothetical protein
MEPPGEHIESTTVRLRGACDREKQTYKTATLYRNRHSAVGTAPLCSVTNDASEQFLTLSRTFPKGRLITFASRGTGGESGNPFAPVHLDYVPAAPTVGGENEEDTPDAREACNAACDAATVTFLERYMEESICNVFAQCGDWRRYGGGRVGGPEEEEVGASSGSPWSAASAASATAAAGGHRLRITGDVELFAPKRGTNLGWHRDGYQRGIYIAHVLAAAVDEGGEGGENDAPWFEHGGVWARCLLQDVQCTVHGVWYR